MQGGLDQLIGCCGREEEGEVGNDSRDPEQPSERWCHSPTSSRGAVLEKNGREQCEWREGGHGVVAVADDLWSPSFIHKP